jgi:dienelactone hydrolase
MLITLLIGAASACAGAGASRPPEPAHELRAPAVRPTEIPGFVRELTTLDAVFPSGSTIGLDALITRPDTPGRLPTVILTHGSPREPAKRATMTPTQYAANAMAFARRGYAVVVIMRRGYGATGGRYAESSGGCTNPDYVRSGRVSAEDLLAALRLLRSESWMDPERVLLVGHSAGGWAAIAGASSRAPGVVGVISFAGGRGSVAPDQVCDPDRLISAMSTFGKTARVPSLWVYSENDHYFSPALARGMADAYRSSGAPVDLVMAPSFSEDGHMLFSRGAPDEWWPLLTPFLEKLRLPVALTAAPLPIALPPPPSLKANGIAGFARYVESEAFEKAFAVDGTAWGWASGRRTTDDAIEGALDSCTKHAAHCAIYAVGNARAPAR